ncbi:carbon-phosphorus lyase complex subunit PhnI [Streptomyces sp. TS71-3]|uniref:carbon-phosphorus lyase complex subunit PhnI n=1 Tax=Streptomyces sp. TS71-3 TaxID=2733862 RepID=UPI001B229AAD|nr:carbon-phosphorus lyase complex subunit PhnI [Streptomyces sp. TS71-3]GHJ35616.1 carbon-phosphorus lyase [Streptomyces sp. TS71-3]
MGYAGVRGGQEAIAAAERLVRAARYGGRSAWLELDQITGGLPLAVDRVMGEGGLWAPEITARAIRQSQGDLLEAAQLLRAHRSTMPRLGYSLPVPMDEAGTTRRVSAAYRNPPGGQFLGATADYVPQILDLGDGDGADLAGDPGAAPAAPDPAGTTGAAGAPPGLLAELREAGLLAERPSRADAEPFDITRTPARPGAPRSGRLSAMARAETGSLVHLWYSVIRRPEHVAPEIPVELRRRTLPVRVAHPYTGRPVTVARAEVTEARTVRGAGVPGEDPTRFDVGYGLCFGAVEAKALAMAGLDLLVHRAPEADRLEQKVLTHLDGPEASGFLEHLKLPHYVDFRSALERLRAVHTTAGGAR